MSTYVANSVSKCTPSVSWLGKAIWLPHIESVGKTNVGRHKQMLVRKHVLVGKKFPVLSYMHYVGKTLLFGKTFVD